MVWSLFRYRVCERACLLFDYRALDVDRARGDDELDFITHGPTVGLRFHF